MENLMTLVITVIGSVGATCIEANNGIVNPCLGRLQYYGLLHTYNMGCTIYY